MVRRRARRRPISPFAALGLALVTAVPLFVVASSGTFALAPDPPPDEYPVLMSMPSPIYPEEAKKARVEGTVQVTFVVDREGGVQDACAQGDERLVPAVLDAVKSAKFRPATRDGSPVACTLCLPIRFELDRAEEEGDSG
jgi:protein TonB